MYHAVIKCLFYKDIIFTYVFTNVSIKTMMLHAEKRIFRPELGLVFDVTSGIL
jgi:hypothetical protein